LYREKGLAFSFNGGKDCTVLLPFYCDALIKARHGESFDKANGFRDGRHSVPLKVDPKEGKIKAIYFFLSDSFPEIEDFISKAVEDFNLELTKIPSVNMKKGMEEYLQKHPEIKAVVAGTRLSDPFSSHLQVFNPTDNGWPEFMRINPILDWDYCHVWEIMKAYSIPYCCLYDQG